MAFIKITPDTLRDESGKLTGLCDQHEDVFNQMKALVDNLNSQWEGAAMMAFVESFTKAETEQKNFKEMLLTFAQNMTISAQQLEDADNDLAAKLK